MEQANPPSHGLMTEDDVMVPYALDLPLRVGLCCRLDKEKALAFAMASHARLGSASFASVLVDDLAQRIVDTAATWPQGELAKNLSKSCLRLMGGAFVKSLEGNHLEASDKPVSASAGGAGGGGASLFSMAQRPKKTAAQAAHAHRKHCVCHHNRLRRKCPECTTQCEKKHHRHKNKTPLAATRSASASPSTRHPNRVMSLPSAPPVLPFGLGVMDRPEAFNSTSAVVLWDDTKKWIDHLFKEVCSNKKQRFLKEIGMVECELEIWHRYPCFVSVSIYAGKLCH